MPAGKCGTDSAPKKCLRRQLAALQKAAVVAPVGVEGGTDGQAAQVAAEQRALERARRETWSLPLGQGSGASSKRGPGM